MLPLFSLLPVLLLSTYARAQSSVNVSTSTDVFTSSVPASTTINVAGRQSVSSFFVPTTVTSLVAVTHTLSLSSSSTLTPTPTPTGPPPIKLDTVLDPGFGVLGAILILTGLPSAFLGHKNRWSSYFLTGFYSLSGICLALILKFGVLAAVNPPSEALRGLFVLACGIAGIGGGSISILFWNQAKYFVGALGGFAFGIWVQCFRNGGVIRPIGFRWILYIACGVIGFILCTIPKIHYHTLLTATAFVGATAFMLGVDCYTLVGLKEFYVYNLGFAALFPKYANKPFPVSQTMQIELGLIAATALAGMAIQMRILAVLQIKLKQIKIEQKRRNDEIEAKAADRFAEVERDLERWENEHGHGFKGPTFPKPDGPETPGGQSDDTLIGKRARMASGLSEFVAPPLESAEDKRQSIGILPVMNLGTDIEEELPTEFVASPGEASTTKAAGKTTETKEPILKEKENILADIDEIRKSIDWLRNQSPAPSVAGIESRRVSTTSRPRTISQDLGTASRMFAGSSALPATSRPRVQSMDVLSHIQGAPSGSEQSARGRTNSTPLRDDEWDAYVQERQLFTPPTGVSPPIPTTDKRRPASMLLSMPKSVKDALEERKRRESAFEMADSVIASETPRSHSGDSSSHGPQNPDMVHKKRQSSSGLPVQILPPVKAQQEATPERPEPVRTRTYEELAERHRRKMHDLQSPLSQAEKEQAALESAKSRWERSKQIEREEFKKRQAEKLAAAVKEKDKSKASPTERQSRRSTFEHTGPHHRASRSLTPDQLSAIPDVAGGGRRSSTAKVLEWQRHQETDAEAEQRRAVSPPPGRKSVGGGGNVSNNVPFPGGGGSARPPREHPVRRSGGNARS